MSIENKMPEIRFKRFGGEWENLTLGENAKFFKGQGYSKGDLVTNGAPIILYGRLYTRYQTVITAVDTFVTEKDKSVKSIGGEVIVPASGESPEDISRASVVSEPNIILGGDLNIVLPNKKIHPIFLALAISNGRLKKHLSSKAQGKSVVHIRNSDLADLDLILPSEYIEQTAIGNYFQKLDTLINQHQQKHEKLTTLKKAMLEKMFPKQGETVPEIRFNGFSGEWEEKILEDICDVRDGTHASPQYHQNGFPLVTSKNVKNGYINYDDVQYISKIDFDEINKRSKVDINDILMGMIGTIGNIALIREAADFAIKNVALIKDKNLINFLYTYYFLQSPIITQQLEDNASGGTQQFISLSNVRRLLTYLPEREEQTAIGNYFQKFDTLINQHQQQITKLNNIKQACLSKMFV
ncbi:MULTISPECIES: restriction endonuclease subunit S [unclassified Providencia]|uniref:restriction endonuclease subunit S n=1 Tax=unclassified Providencia TaxID=2633465 RepID=UPI00234C006D|nr:MULTISPECIES: restriction endonuclease subunit S [unclassified Providencia]